MSIVSSITQFWYTRGNILARVLSPLGFAYSFVAESRVQATKPHVGKPVVICIGNFVVGGAGKTPLALSIADRLKRTNLKICFLTRGYLGKEEGPLLVNPLSHTSKDVGDEALILSKSAPTIVSKNRRAGYEIAEKNGFDIVIMDDEFQNPTVHKDISFIAMDAGAGVGNGLVMPAGPLRMRLRAQLPNVSAIITIGDGFGGETVVQRAKRQYNIPRFRAYFEPDESLKSYIGKSVIAYCGIGRPEKFLETLEDVGIKIPRYQFYTDHYAYKDSDAETLLGLSNKLKMPLLTTEKDYVRLPNDDSPLGQLKKRSVTVPIKLIFEDNKELNQMLKMKLGEALKNKKIQNTSDNNKTKAAASNQSIAQKKMPPSKKEDVS